LSNFFPSGRASHVAQALWDRLIRARQATRMLPLLEAILEEFGRQKLTTPTRTNNDKGLEWAPTSSAYSTKGFNGKLVLISRP
jgi:hypothetical protein